SSEDLRVATRVRNSHLAKSSSAAGWGQCRTILECKAVYAGKRVLAVPAQHTSQDCSRCGARVQKSLWVRTHLCPSCGRVLDRNQNAARNMHWRGQRLVGTRGATCGDEPRTRRAKARRSVRNAGSKCCHTVVKALAPRDGSQLWQFAPGPTFPGSLA